MWYSIKFKVSFSVVNSVVQQTAHECPTLKNTVEMLHKLN